MSWWLWIPVGLASAVVLWLAGCIVAIALNRRDWFDDWPGRGD